MNASEILEIFQKNWETSMGLHGYTEEPWQELELRLTGAFAGHDTAAVHRIMCESQRLYQEQRLPVSLVQVPRMEFDQFKLRLCCMLLGDPRKDISAEGKARYACYTGSQKPVIGLEWLRKSLVKALPDEPNTHLLCRYLVHTSRGYGFRLYDDMTYGPRQRVLQHVEFKALSANDHRPFYWSFVEAPDR